MTYWTRSDNAAVITYTLRDEYLAPRPDDGGLRHFMVSVFRASGKLFVTQDEKPHQASVPMDAMAELIADFNAEGTR